MADSFLCCDKSGGSWAAKGVDRPSLLTDFIFGMPVKFPSSVPETIKFHYCAGQSALTTDLDFQSSDSKGLEVSALVH